jgi:hypothetical protein
MFCSTFASVGDEHVEFRVGLAISDKKNYSAEDGMDGTIGSFRRNSGCSENSRNSVPNHSLKEKNA